MTNNRFLIIDCEYIIYKAMTACKIFKQCETDKYIYGEYYDIRKGLEYFDKEITRICTLLGSQDYQCVVGDSNNFRKNLYSNYKSNRPEKPPLYPVLFNYINSVYNFTSLLNLEGDDTARIMFEDKSYQPKKEKIIVSCDKDFYSVPCFFARDVQSNPELQIEIVTEHDARKHLMYQTIVGDSVDGYKGIPQFGDKKAKEFITDDTLWYDILKLYKDNGLTGSDYTMNKVCATIVSIKQYDFETGNIDISKGE